MSYGPAHTRYRIVLNEGGATVTTTYIGGLFKIVQKASGTEYLHTIKVGTSAIVQLKIGSDGSRSIIYLHHDVIGSTESVTNVLGEVIARSSYSAFGAPRDPNGPSLGPLPNDGSSSNIPGYTGHEQLDAVDLVNMTGRIYDPRVGRFHRPGAVLQPELQPLQLCVE